MYTSYRVVYIIDSQWAIHPYSRDFIFLAHGPPFMCTHAQHSGGRFDHIWIRGDPVSDSSGTWDGQSHDPDYWATFNGPPWVTFNDDANWLLWMPSLRVDA